MNIDVKDPKERDFLHKVVFNNFVAYHTLMNSYKKAGSKCIYCHKPLTAREEGYYFCTFSSADFPFSCAYIWLAEHPDIVLEWLTNETK